MYKQFATMVVLVLVVVAVSGCSSATAQGVAETAGAGFSAFGQTMSGGAQQRMQQQRSSSSQQPRYQGSKIACLRSSDCFMDERCMFDAYGSGICVSGR